jgi:enamine deaminase RidA (YjgF/YER057c/UK114 family)
MKPEVVFTKAAPKTGFSEGTESPIAQGVRCGDFVFVSGRDMKDFGVFNRVFKEYMKGVQPARTTVEASPPRAGVNVEIDAIAWIPR